MGETLKQYKEDLSWEDKAKINPLYAIMSDEIFASSSVVPTDEQLSSFYDQGHRFWKRWFRPIFWDVEDLGKMKVLEYGCGMGRIANSAAADGLQAYGVDISRSQVEYAKRYCPNANNIEFAVLSERNEVPYSTNTFDVVYSYAVLQHIKGRRAFELAIQEMARVLKDGGKLKLQLRTIHGLFKDGIQDGYMAWVFEDFTIAFYFRKIGFFKVPKIKKIKHTNWSGSGCFFSCSGIKKILFANNVRIDSIEFDTINNLLWIVGLKKENF